MALPKRRHSVTRKRKKRANKALKSPNLGLCPRCNEPKPAHRVCSNCGYYKGAPVIEVKAK
jgi:large subunit ribosomal protein L32